MALEVWWAPYPIGFDPMGVYIPFITGYRTLEYSIYELGPLYYLALQNLYTLLRDPFLSVKILAVLLQGLLALSLYLYSKVMLKDPWRPLIFSLAVSFYFPVLRITWDLHRNVSGLMLLFLTLWLIEKKSKLSIPSAILSAIAHPTIPPLLFISLLPAIRRKNLPKMIAIIVATIAIAIPLYVIFYAQAPTDFSINSKALELILYTMIPLTPFLTLSLITLRKNADLLLLSVVTTLLAALTFTTQRFAILAPFFLTCLTVLGCLTLETSLRYTAILSTFILLVIGVFAAGYTLMPSQHPFNYFAPPYMWNPRFLNAMPSSLQQNTIPVNQADNVMNLMDVAANKYDDAPLMTNQATLPYALLANFPKERLFYKGGPNWTPVYSNPQGLSIWFLPGNDWYGLRVEGACFRILETKGEMALYGHIYTQYGAGHDQWRTWTLSEGYLLLNATTDVKGKILLSRLKDSNMEIRIPLKIDEVKGDSPARIGIALAQPEWPPRNFYFIGLESNPNTIKAHAIIGIQKADEWTLIAKPDFETPLEEWVEIWFNASSSSNTIQIYYNNKHVATLSNLEIPGPWQVAIARDGNIKAHIDDRELFAKIWGTYPRQD